MEDGGPTPPPPPPPPPRTMSLRLSVEGFPCGSTGEGWGVGLGPAKVSTRVWLWFYLLDSHGARCIVYTMDGFLSCVGERCTLWFIMVLDAN